MLDVVGLGEECFFLGRRKVFLFSLFVFFVFFVDNFLGESCKVFGEVLVILIDLFYSHKKTNEWIHKMMDTCISFEPWPCKRYLFVQFLWKMHGWFYASCGPGRTYPSKKVWAMTSRTKKLKKGKFLSWMFSYVGGTRRQAFFCGSSNGRWEKADDDILSGRIVTTDTIFSQVSRWNQSKKSQKREQKQVSHLNTVVLLVDRKQHFTGTSYNFPKKAEAEMT